MKRTNSQGFLIRYQYPQRLVKWREAFSKLEPIQPAREPLEPFMSVTDDVLSIREARSVLGITFLLPLVIGLWVLSFNFVGDLGWNSASIDSAKRRLIEYQQKEAQGIPLDARKVLLDDNLKKKFIYYRYNTTQYSRDEHERTYHFYKVMFGHDGEYSFLGYVNAVFAYGTERQRESLITDLVIASVSSILALYFTLFFFKSPKPASIYFDRKRGIVYTWFFGRLAACRFENLGFLERQTGMLLYLYGENKKGKGGYDIVPITIQPVAKLRFNVERGNDYLLAQLFNFMDNGKSALITGKSFHRDDSNIYFCVDKKPEPFEERLEKLLEHEHVLPDLYANLKVVN